MFLGEYVSQIGEKNRILLPKRLRDEIVDSIVYVTRGYEECLILLDRQRWVTLIQEISKRPILSIDVRDTKRYILGGSVEVELDNQGRFVLSEELINFAKLGPKIVFLGVGEWIEIWDYDKWSKKLEYLTKNVADLGERLSNL
jgi:MraZ protein